MLPWHRPAVTSNVPAIELPATVAVILAISVVFVTNDPVTMAPDTVAMMALASKQMEPGKSAVPDTADPLWVSVTVAVPLRELPTVCHGPVHVPLTLASSQAPEVHAWPVKQTTHACPPLPHAVFVVPSTHCPAEQHPVAQAVAVQTHAPLTHCKPVAHAPLTHEPPQPSLAPHAAPTQFGVHSQTALEPEPLQVSGLAHGWPAQHD
jgi:hypothetical protein